MALKIKSTVSFTDNLATIEGLGLTHGVALLKITDGLGNTIYKNSGYDTDSYTYPDIISVTTKNKVLSIQNKNSYFLNVKIAELILDSTYTKSVSADSTIKKITITDVSTVERDNIIKFGHVYINSIYYTIDSYTYVDTTLEITSNDVTTTYSGSLPIEYYKIDTSESYVKEMKVCYTAAVVDITYNILCDTSQLTSTDNSDYVCTFSNSTQIAAYTSVRTHSVVAPIGSGFGVIPDSVEKSRTFTGIWTKTWSTAISTDVVYNVESWSEIDSTIWLVYTDTVKGSDTALVQCNKCSCEYRNCIMTIYNTWISSNYGRQREILGNDVLKLTSLYTQYLQAERCGASTYDICSAMVEILKSYNCDCYLIDVDAASTYVEPIREAATGSMVYMDNGVPTIAGNENDVYIDLLTSDLYQYTTEWILQGSLKGVKGDKGDKGNNGQTFISFNVDLSTNNINSQHLITGVSFYPSFYVSVVALTDITVADGLVKLTDDTITQSIIIPAGTLAGQVITNEILFGVNMIDILEVLSIGGVGTIGTITVNIYSYNG